MALGEFPTVIVLSKHRQCVGSYMFYKIHTGAPPWGLLKAINKKKKRKDSENRQKRVSFATRW